MPQAVDNSTKGNRPGEYKRPEDVGRRIEAMLVQMWRRRITRAADVLGIAARVKDAKAGDEYLEGKAVAKNDRVIYYRYLLPLLEEAHRKTLPAVPGPQAEPRTEEANTPIGTEPVIGPDGAPQTVPAGPTWAELAQELIDLCFNSPYADVPEVMEDMQWDDARGGVAFLKTQWHIEAEPAEVVPEMDDERQALAVQQAEAENEDPARAAIAASDIDYIHVDVHGEAIDSVRMMHLLQEAQAGVPVPEPPELAALVAHVEDHQSRMVMVKRERPTVERVPWFLFVYDPDVPWRKRAWECEERSIRIGELLRMGCRNVNAQNLPAEQKPGEGMLPYEDRTGRVYDIHDRDAGMRYIIPVAGPEDGAFLLKERWRWGSIDVYQPFVTRPYKPGQLVGIPSIQACIPILDKLARVDFYINRHVESHASYKVGLPEGTDSRVNGAMNDPDRRFFPVTPKMAAMGKMEWAPPPIPATLLEQRGNLIGELRRILGIDAQDTGAPQPHQITATESYNRAEAKQDRKHDRQERMGNLLARVAKNFLHLYKRFASQEVMARVLGPEGATFHRFNPADIPDDLDVYFDIQAETEDQKAQTDAKWEQIIQTAARIPVPINWQEMWEAYLTAKGIRHPERFRADMPEGAEQMLGEMTGSPGTPNDTIQFPGGGQGGAPYQPPEEQTGFAGA